MNVQQFLSLTTQKFNIILADPPWFYNDRKLFRRDNPEKKNKFGMGACNHYATMKPEEIYDLPVKRIADKNCYCFMWCTMPNLEIGMKALYFWGFRYVTTPFVWVKTNSVSVSLYAGPGNYTMSNAEVVLLGRIGKTLKREHRDVRSVIMAPRREHSRKPTEIKDRVVHLLGDIPRVELFSCEETEGWVCVGNQIGKYEKGD